MSVWLSSFQRPSLAPVRLICLPFAGGGDAAFRPLRPFLPARIDVLGVRLPGRGARLREPPMKDLPQLIEALGAALLPAMDRDVAQKKLQALAQGAELARRRYG